MEKINSSNIICPSCGAEVPSNSNFCLNCGTKIEKNQTILCPNCKAEIPSNSTFCLQCGTKIKDATEPTITIAPENKVVKDNEYLYTHPCDFDDFIEVQTRLSLGLKPYGNKEALDYVNFNYASTISELEKTVNQYKEAYIKKNKASGSADLYLFVIVFGFIVCAVLWALKRTNIMIWAAVITALLLMFRMIKSEEKRKNDDVIFDCCKKIYETFNMLIYCNKFAQTTFLNTNDELIIENKYPKYTTDIHNNTKHKNRSDEFSNKVAEYKKYEQIIKEEMDKQYDETKKNAELLNDFLPKEYMNVENMMAFAKIITNHRANSYYNAINIFLSDLKMDEHNKRLFEEQKRSNLEIEKAAKAQADAAARIAKKQEAELLKQKYEAQDRKYKLNRAKAKYDSANSYYQNALRFGNAKEIAIRKAEMDKAYAEMIQYK